MIQPHHRTYINRANELVARQCIERTTAGGRELENMAQELALICTELVQQLEDASTRICEMDHRSKSARTKPMGYENLDEAIVFIVDRHHPVDRLSIATAIDQSNNESVEDEVQDAIFRSDLLSKLTRTAAVADLVRRRLDYLAKQHQLAYLRQPVKKTGWYIHPDMESAAQ